MNLNEILEQQKEQRKNLLLDYEHAVVCIDNQLDRLEPHRGIVIGIDKIVEDLKQSKKDLYNQFKLDFCILRDNINITEARIELTKETPHD